MASEAVADSDRDASLLAHSVSGSGSPPIVFVHGLTCDGTDWDAQVPHLSPRHEVITVDLRWHGASGGQIGRTIEQHGADVAALLRALSRTGYVLVGHSLGSRVVLEAALAVPELVSGVVFVDGNQFPPAAMDAIRAGTATPDGYRAYLGEMFAAMFTPGSDPGRRQAIIARALSVSPSLGPALLRDLARYDNERMDATLPRLAAPLLVIQATGRTEQNVRISLTEGARTPYLDMLRATLPGARIAIVPDCGHFPQIDRSDRVNALLDGFIATLQTGSREG